MGILKVLFPNPELVEAANMKIRVQVMPFSDIDWKFQSSLKGFRSFPAKPLQHYVTTSSPGFENVLELELPEDSENMNENYCFVCQEAKSVIGHTTESCLQIRCKTCGQRGHTVRNCPDFNPKT